jgi:60 kDa SS-A/Ro ribonucleoprotein
MSNKYGKHFSTKNATQGQKLPGSNQIQNSDGAYVYGVDDWTRLDRFLILGSEGGSYYASEQKLTVANCEASLRCIQKDGERVVKTVAEISDQGRAPKNDPAIFVLAMAAKLGDDKTRKAAYEALPKVCRIPTHLFHFVDYAEGFGGWGRGMKRAVSKWYTEGSSEKLARHLVKYQGRDGWTNRDLMRLAHPRTEDAVKNSLIRWATKGELKDPGVLKMATASDVSGFFHVQAFEHAKQAKTTREIVALINEFGLPREAVPTQFLKEPTVWDALLQRMPIGAMIRNLGNMSKVGLLVPMSKAAGLVVDRISNTEIIQRGRIHPLQILMAMNTYNKGRGIRGNSTWTPVPQVVDALDKAFYESFQAVEPTNKRTMIALDTSGSMAFYECAGMTGITPRVASAALSLITANIEKNHVIINYSEKASELSISPRMRLTEVIAHVNKCAALGTDCAAPIERAIERGYEVDTFIIYTDNETNKKGSRQPVVALRDYRQRTGIPAKLIVVGMISNGFTVADPDDAGMLDVVGFDTATPSVISNFSKD